MPIFTRFSLQHRRLPIQFSIFVTLLLASIWGRLSNASPSFSAEYSLGFAVTWGMLITIGVWLLLGLPGLRTMLLSRVRLVWLIVISILALWSSASQFWALMEATRPEIAQGRALQTIIALAFWVVTACVAPAPRWVARLLILLMLIHGAIGAVQVARHAPLGLAALGEIRFDPERSGTSVIQSGETRWLRPYGLLPHPNMLAGIFVLGTLCAGAAALDESNKRRWLYTAFFTFGIWMLLLSFSRSAWLATGAAGLAVLPWLIRSRAQLRRSLPTLGALLATGALFLAFYAPLLLARAGVGSENTEMRSIADRAVFTQIAMTAIQRAPWQGLGAANYPWYAADYLWRFTDYDLRGDNVHHIGLLLWSELGLIGLLLFFAAISLSVRLALDSIRCDPAPRTRVMLLAGAAAFLLIGFFDHYPWTIIHFQALWFAALGTAMAPVDLAQPAEPPHNLHP